MNKKEVLSILNNTIEYFKNLSDEENIALSKRIDGFLEKRNYLNRRGAEMKYLYESHLDRYHISDKYVESTYCEVCGDSDIYIGEFENSEDLFYIIVEYLACNDGCINKRYFFEEIHNELGDEEFFNETLNKIKNFALDLLKEVDGK